MTLQRLSQYLGYSVLGAMIFAVLAIAVSEVHSFDVFWQLQSGRYMSETKSFIRSDLFTLAKDVLRAEHTWLHSLILYALYLLGGYSAISVLKGLVVTGTLSVLVWTARTRGASFPAIAITVPLFLMTSGGWLERPQIWTFLCFALFLYAFESFLRKPSWRILFLLPLALFWSNAHAAYVLAAAIFCAYFVGEGLQALWEKRLSEAALPKLLVLACGLLFASQVNPYSANLLRAIKESGKQVSAKSSEVVATGAGKAATPMTHAFNMDWTPTTFQQEPVFFYVMGVAFLVFVLGWRRLKLNDLCLIGGLAIMGLTLVRHIPFYYMGLIAICPVYLDAAVDPLRKSLPKTFYRSVPFAVLLCSAIIFWWLYTPQYKVYGAFNTGLRSWHYPIEATEFVKEHNLPKNIYNTYDWGGYMAWKLYPEYLMFWDGRQNSSEMFRLGWQVMAGQHGWESILERFDVKTVVSRASTIDTGQKYPLLDRLRGSPDWSLVFNAESSMIFVRNDSVPAEWLKLNARPKMRMDDTILSEAHLMVKYNANRYMAWWEMAQVYAKRRQYKNALFALNQHIGRAPRTSPAAERLREQLLWSMKGKRSS